MSEISFKEKILNLLDRQEFTEASKVLELKLAENQYKNDSLLLMDIATSLIDLGDESLNIINVQKGLNLIEENLSVLSKVVTEASLHYCLANAYQSLFKIESLANKNLYPTPLDVKDNLAKAKSAY